MYKRITTNTLQEMKLKNEKISMLTAYDFTFARIVDEANVDVILVGDSDTCGHTRIQGSPDVVAGR